MQAVRFARVCLEESVLYAAKRRTFGKALIQHPVIRWKVAEMARQVEATHAYLEQITLQMNRMDESEGMVRLGGDTALLKVRSPALEGKRTTRATRFDTKVAVAHTSTARRVPSPLGAQY